MRSHEYAKISKSRKGAFLAVNPVAGTDCHLVEFAGNAGSRRSKIADTESVIVGGISWKFL